MDKKVILLFQSTHETLSAEKIFLEDDIKAKPRTKPRSITSECGIGLEVLEKCLPEINALCQKNKFTLRGIYREFKNKTWVEVKD